jgi:hypothetical protein
MVFAHRLPVEARIDESTNEDMMNDGITFMMVGNKSAVHQRRSRVGRTMVLEMYCCAIE